jgi:hypothetical protein
MSISTEAIPQIIHHRIQKILTIHDNTQEEKTKGRRTRNNTNQPNNDKTLGIRNKDSSRGFKRW